MRTRNKQQPAAVELSPDEAHARKSERTLLLSWLLSSPGPIVSAIAVAMSSSATQIADAIRRAVELGALITGWVVFRRRQREPSPEARAALERRSEVTVGVAMAISGVVMLGIGLYRFFNSQPGGNVVVGLIVALLATGVNGTFWFRYSRLLRHAEDPVLASQRTLYRAKTVVDLGVAAALTSVAVIPDHPVTHYVDTLGSVLVSVYVMYQALSTLRKQRQTTTAN